MTLIKHIPALQVLVPFFAALFCALSFNKLASWLIATITIAISLAIAVYSMPMAQESIFYAFGDWHAPIGIEYRLDYLNQPIILYVNAVLLFFLIFGKQLINQTITRYIDDRKHHLFYSLLLFAHAGYLGVLSTNDLFNIYVFIEISSLATYVLMSKGNNPKALIGALDYLMLGTIGATMILISIGFFLSITGSLNISDISQILQNNHESESILIVAIAFFLTGAILKMAFFPLHFWMIRAYSSSAPFILTYISAISSLLGIYLIVRFIHFTIEAELIYIPVSIVLRSMALMTIVICTYFALKSKDIKAIAIYSSASQIGYIFLLLSIETTKPLIFGSLLLGLLILDSINKVGLFTLISHIQNKTNDLNIDSIKQIKNSGLFKVLAGFIIIFSAGLPLTSMFLVKVKILDLLIRQNLILEFITVIIATILGLLYHLKFVKAIFFSKQENGGMVIDTNVIGLITIVIIQFLTLLYVGDIVN